ncbi:MAG: AhpD family alkylhydroperoxidase [Oleispira sp.]|jgi:AhpD family alkylhydroperoxidase
MTIRIDIHQLEPKAYQAMFGLEGYLAETDLTPCIKELIKLKASMINKCAYCIQMHSEHARKHGESEHRIYALPAWQESPLFTAEERAVLALTEEVTLISGHGLSHATYQSCLEFFSEPQVAQLIMQVVTINAWNRIAVATKMVYQGS